MSIAFKNHYFCVQCSLLYVNRRFSSGLFPLSVRKWVSWMAKTSISALDLVKPSTLICIIFIFLFVPVLLITQFIIVLVFYTTAGCTFESGWSERWDTKTFPDLYFVAEDQDGLPLSIIRVIGGKFLTSQHYPVIISI